VFAKEQAAPAPHAADIPVLVSKVTQRAMPVQLAAIGNVGGFTVSAKAQVAGELLAVHFKEGDFVHKDQLLFTIDPRPYEAALAQAQATLLRDKAVAANSRSQAQRISKLLTDGVVSPSDAGTSKSAADAAEATVAADEAAVKAAQLNLEYCTIYSPIVYREARSGRHGDGGNARENHQDTESDGPVQGMPCNVDDRCCAHGGLHFEELQGYRGEVQITA